MGVPFSTCELALCSSLYVVMEPSFRDFSQSYVSPLLGSHLEHRVNVKPLSRGRWTQCHINKPHICACMGPQALACAHIHVSSCVALPW